MRSKKPKVRVMNPSSHCGKGSGGGREREGEKKMTGVGEIVLLKRIDPLTGRVISLIYKHEEE